MSWILVLVLINSNYSHRAENFSEAIVITQSFRTEATCYKIGRTIREMNRTRITDFTCIREE